MGCYLSQPDTNVYVTEGRGRKYAYATASCQGWRRDQEDAEAVIPDFEDDASLFVLCDGHGGAEVAQYTVEHFPNFLKEQPLYKEGKYKEALEKAFVDFDALLRTPEVQQQLVKLSYDGSEKDKAKQVSESNELAKDTKSSTSDENKSNGSSQSDSAISSHKLIHPEVTEIDALSSTTGTTDAIASGSAGCPSSSSSGSSSSRPQTVADDVDSETLRKEAQLPLAEVLTGYAAKLGGAYAGSPVVKAKKETSQDEGESAGGTDDPKASSSSSVQITPETMKENLIKQVLQRYFPGTADTGEEADDGSSSEDDSEFDAGVNAEEDDDDDDDDDQDDDDDDDDDEESSSEDDEEDDDDEDESDEDDEESEGDEGDDDLEVSGEDEEVQRDGAQDDNDEEKKRLVKKPKQVSIMSLLRKRKRSKKSKGDDDEDSDSEGEVDDINRLFLTSQVVEKLQLGSKMQARTHKPGVDSGCTVVVTLVKDNKLYSASAGDSRCILIKRSGDCIPMSIDHKPEDKTEYDRIKAAGGEVIDGRVNSGLNLSRAFGDFSYKHEKLPADKQMITPCPDVRVATIDPENLEYIFLACDGIWNSFNNNQTSKFLMKTAESNNHDLVETCVQLFRKCISPKTDGDGTGCDNMTCILVRLDKPSEVERSDQDVEEMVPSDTKHDLKNKEDMNNEELQKSENQPHAEETEGQTDEQATTNSIKRSNSSSSCTDLMPPKKRCLSL